MSIKGIPATRTTTPPATRRPLLLLGLWLGAASALVASGAFAQLPTRTPQAVLGLLVVVQVALYFSTRGFRAWADALSLRALVALHLSRFVGFYFLVLNGRGELPYDFAVLGGWGDIAVATTAIALLYAYRRGLRPRAIPLVAWNVLALADILFVVSRAAKNLGADPTSMQPLTVLPLGLLPLFLVPLIISTHLLMLRRAVQPTA